MKNAKEFLVDLQALCFKHKVKFTSSTGKVDEDSEIATLTAEPEGCLIEVRDTKAIGSQRNKRLKVGVGKFGS
jgi:hypothetical protein